MAKKSGLSDIGLILALIGGIIMAIFGILRIIGYFIEDINTSDYMDISILGSGASEGALAGGIIALVLGIILIWVWKEKKVGTGDSILIWGIIFIVFGLIGGSLGGLLVLIAGILLLIDYFV
ncbi:MAG: hypothetical protein ACXAC7_16005 [Candidatus Hodarchaeales archaeon]|jgi:hypothetical protein